jgi:hypothetical protein
MVSGARAPAPPVSRFPFPWLSLPCQSFLPFDRPFFLTQPIKDALEWTTTSVKVWSFAPGSEPSDLLAQTPEPGNWPTPHMEMEINTCSDIADAFGPMNIILSVNFCGNPVASDAIWGQTCAASTGTSCDSFVGNNPSAFSNVYFQLNRMEIYQT